MAKCVKSISLSIEAINFIEENRISLSKFVEEKIKEVMKIGDDKLSEGSV